MLCLNSCVIFLGIIAQFMPVTTQLTQCYSELCFTISDYNQTRTFNQAKSWCSENSSVLAVVADQSIQDALTSVLSSLSSSPLGLMYINAKLQQQTTVPQTWFLLNGTNYAGNIGEQDTAQYRYYMYVEYRNQGNFYAYASSPLNMKNYICEYDDNICSNVSSNSTYRNYGRCYIKYENESLSWYKARERCKNNGGDLMMCSGNTVSWEISTTFNTSWLNLSLSYWVGVRWNNRTWFSLDNGPEIVYTNWSSGKPNNYTLECICVDPNGNPKWSWTDCDCNIKRQFLCFKTVRTTMPTTRIPATVAISTLNPLTGVNAPIGSNNTDNDMGKKIALGVGIGVGGFIVIIIVAVVVIVVVMKRRKNASTQEQDNEVNKTVKTKTSNIDKVMEVKNGDDSSQMYATVLSSTVSNEIKESSGNTGEVVYTQPEFFGTVKSESPYSDPGDSVTSRSRNGDVVSKNRTRTLLPSSTGDIYANVERDE